MELIYKLEEITSAAKEFIQYTLMDKVFLLEADMAAGKTTFIKEICGQKGVDENVSSPTFSIINEYRTAGGKTIYHLDLYRLESEDEARQAGVEECIYSGDECYIEWPQRAAGLMPVEAVLVKIEVLDDQTRKLSINRSAELTENR